MDTPSTKAENDWPSGGVQLSRASQKQPRFSFNRKDRTNPSTFNGVASPHWQTRESNPPRIFGLNRTQTDGQRRSQTPSSSTPEGHPRIRQTNSGNSRRSRLIMESKLLKSEHDVGLLPVKFQDEDDETFGAHTFTSGIGGLSNIGLDSNPAQQDHSVFITQNVRRRSVHLGGNDEQFNVHRARSVKPEPNLAEYSQPYIGHHDSSTARLRSGSVLGSVLDQSEDDISSIMMRGATDLRNAKVTIEEQRSEIDTLRSQLGSAADEKREILRRLDAVKDATKKSLEASSRSLESLHSSVDSLKAQSTGSFAVFEEAKASVGDVGELRQLIKDTLGGLEPLIDGDGRLHQAEELREVVNELQGEYTNVQHVSDILRDKLQNIGAELVEAKSRVSSLEQAQAGDRDALRVSSNALSDATQQVNILASQFQKQQEDMNDLVNLSSEVQAKLSASNERVDDLNKTIISNNLEIESLRKFQQECVTLQTILKEREAYIVSLEGVKQSLATAEQKSAQLEAHAKSLELAIAEGKGREVDLNARLARKEEVLETNQNEIKRLEEELSACRAQKEVHQHEASMRSKDIEDLKTKLESTEQELRQSRKEVDAGIQRFHQGEIRCKVLEERFEDQTITLRLTKESLGDLQERLIETESRTARNVENLSGKHACEIALLEERNSSMATRVQELEARLQYQKDENVAVRKDLEERFVRQEEDIKATLELEKKCVAQLEADLVASRTAATGIQERLEEALTEVARLEGKLQASSDVPQRLQGELDTLRTSLKNVETTNAELADRARTIESRYKAGDLNEHEKVFINTLIQTSQSIHEQELVAKGNELRRRDNTIADLRSRITLLESTLAKHLKTKAKAQAIPGQDNRSLIDPTAWVSSEKSSSPCGPLAEVTTAVVPVSNLVNTTNIQCPLSPAPQLLPQVPVAIPCKTPRPPVRALMAERTPVPTTSRANLSNVDNALASKPKFGNLARICSDEIEDFDPILSRPGTPPELGKRANPPNVQSPAAAESGKKPVKRMRAATRSRQEGRSVQEPAPKMTEATTSKLRTRRRR